MFKNYLDEEIIKINKNKIDKKYDLLKNVKNNINNIYKNTPIDEIDINVKPTLVKKNFQMEQIKNLCHNNKIVTSTINDYTTSSIKKNFESNINYTKNKTTTKIY